jgi:methylenetetrahydrofolate dehydrogenase (NADP+)/methenyltetrahydrofolate cyclohydrolase
MTTAHIIDGRALANNEIDDLSQSIARTSSQSQPGLATILVGHDPASAIYVANKRRSAQKIGIRSFHHHLEHDAKEDDVITLICQLNENHAIHAILVQLPLPRHINENRIIDSIDPQKDVDGIHPLNLGYLLRGEPRIVACTPLGIIQIIRSVNFSMAGKHAVIIGRSNIVGKPMAHLLLQEDATVTICHKETKNLAEISRQADVVVVAVGKEKLINRSHIKEGAFVIDVGINRDDINRLCGDVDFLDVLKVASYITPVPGGVGPMTIAMLLKNTFTNFLRIGA